MVMGESPHSYNGVILKLRFSPDYIFYLCIELFHLASGGRDTQTFVKRPFKVGRSFYDNSNCHVISVPSKKRQNVRQNTIKLVTDNKIVAPCISFVLQNNR